MKINKIIVDNAKGFRGLPNGFEVVFKNAFNRLEIDPICLAGLNGSGKSNVLELISEIFFYLEAVFNSTAKQYIAIKSPFGFYIEYETKITANNYLLDLREDENNTPLDQIINKTRTVYITKPRRKAPEVYVQVEGTENKIFIDPDYINYEDNIKKLLPAKVIAYSSGQNELISNPFLRMDFFYFEEFLKDTEDLGETAEIANNRLFYMDYQSNPFVLLSNFLMKDTLDSDKNKELDILKTVTDVADITSFNLVLNLKVKKEHSADQLQETIENLRGADTDSVLKEIEQQLFWEVQIPYQLTSFVQKLEQCSTYSDFVYKEEGSEKWLKVTLYYKDIDKGTKAAFQDKFKNGVNLFRQFYLMDLLNIYNYAEDTRETVKKATAGTSDNISDIIPELPKKDKVFYIDALQLKKIIKPSQKLYYKNLSDGEHQFMHIVGTLLLMEEEGAVFLLDEPSTHFNPEWKAKFIYTINEIYKLKIARFQDTEKAQQLVMLSTHSPFVLSDSKTKNVLWFKKENGKPFIEELDFETYGASVDYIMKMFSGSNHLIPKRAYVDLRKVIEEGSIKELRAAIEKYGESSEKQFLYKRLYQLKEGGDND